MTAWSLPSFIHTCEIKGTWNRKGLRLQLTDLHHDRRLLDYRIKSDGTAEGHFGRAPDTHRSVLLLGSQSARNQILTGTWHYTGGREPVVQFFNGQAWVPDPDQTKRYRRLIKDFPSAVDRTHS
ncbi:MAG TPA: hypothetical protein VGE55_02060 [Limnobacter sp.]|uniref:hypothetical protein n=1 Tax=Limnobacter sp. TaxID=2003368 RepID=UPI002EDA80EB